MQSIAEISDVSTKTLYNLFGNRDLLLLEAALEQLVDLEQSPLVLETEPGLPRLHAYTTGSMQQFEDMPEYARAVISIMLRAELEPEAASTRFRPVQRFARESLVVASEQCELRDGLDLTRLSYQIAASVWGVVLLWEKGILALEQLKPAVSLNHYLTLTSVCVGKRRELMEVGLHETLQQTAADAAGPTGKLQLVDG
jgi:AcrR family transcriptional regulator